MKQYIVNSDGTLQEVDTQRIKNYANKEAVEAAIESGELKEGELFTTDVHVGIDTDIVTTVGNIENMLHDLDLENLAEEVTELRTNKVSCTDYNDVVPSSATSSNKLATMADVETRVSNTEYSTDLSGLRSDISDRVTCTDYQSDAAYYSGEITSLGANKVACSDYNAYVTDTDTCIASLVARIAALESCPGLDCTGTVDGSLNGTELTLTGN